MKIAWMGLVAGLLAAVVLAGCVPAAAPTPQGVPVISVSQATASPVANETTPGNPPAATASPAGNGPGVMGGRGGMMGGAGAPPGGSGGLVAVTADGKPIAAASGAPKLPENTTTQKVGNLDVTLALSPYPPVIAKNSSFDITLVDDKGQAVADAKISLDLTMPAMRMPANKPEAAHVGNGKYHATGMWTMRGWWRIEVIIAQGGTKQSAFFDVWL